MAKRVDQNHREIVRALRQVPGMMVFSLHTLGGGIPDLCCGYRGVTALVEVKTEKGKLNALQQQWHAAWEGRPVAVIRNTDDVARLILEITHQSGRDS